MNIYPRIYDINAQQMLGAEVIERVCCPLCGEEAVLVKCKKSFRARLLLRRGQVYRCTECKRVYLSR